MVLEDKIEFIAKDYFYTIVTLEKNLNFKDYFLIMGKVLNLLEKSGYFKSLEEKVIAAEIMIRKFNQGLGNSLPDDYINKAKVVIAHDKSLEPDFLTFKIDDLYEMIHDQHMKERQKYMDEHPNAKEPLF